MGTSASFSLTNLVADASGGLTPTERRLAEAVLAEPTLLAFGTVSDLATRVGASRPSVVRFANKLGFDGYAQLQRLVRVDLSRRLSRPSARIRSDNQAEASARERLNSAIESVFDALEGQNLARLVRPIVRAKKVWILSGETSQAGAHAFYSGLSMVRSGVQLLGDCSVCSQLISGDSGDVAVVFDFFRYRRQVAAAAKILAESDVKIVAVTDGPLSPLIELADAWCEIQVPAIGPFDSSVPVVAIAELFVSRVTKELQDEATARIDRIEAIWEMTETFL